MDLDAFVAGVHRYSPASRVVVPDYETVYGADMRPLTTACTFRVARSHSLFMPVMDVSGMPLGQAVAHSPVRVQPPKPSSSICADHVQHPASPARARPAAARSGG